MNDKPPVNEPEGYKASQGFVKHEPANNEYYVESFKNHPWYGIIKQTHEALEELIPGYNIAQIKEKFGGLRYYFDYPNVIPIRPDWPAYNTEEKIKAMVSQRILYAEAWVDGYEAAKREMR